MIRSHEGADKVLVALVEAYANNPRVDFVAFHNPGGPLAEAPPDSLLPREYTETDERLREQLEAHREDLPEHVYQAALGRFRQRNNRGLGEVREQHGAISEGKPAV